NPFELMAAFNELGFHAPQGSAPTAYMGVGSNLLGNRNADIEGVNTRLSIALRSFRMEDVPGEVLLIFRVLGLLAGRSARLGRPGPPMPAWRRFADAPVAAAS